MRSYTALTAEAALLLLLLVSLAAAADMSIVSYGERSEEETRRMFVEWMATHGKTYYSIVEEERRYAVFKDTLRRVDKHNAAADAGVYTYRRGLNYFSDLTWKEYKAICCGARLLPRNQNKV